MDALTFIAEIVKALAWPATVVVLLLLLRGHLGHLLPRLKKVKHKETEVEFTEALSLVKGEAERRLPTPPKETGIILPTAAAVDAHLMQLVDVSPRSAIIEAWIQVEDAALSSLERVNIDRRRVDPKRRITPRTAAEMLRFLQVIDEDEFAIFERMGRLRNMAAHQTDFHISSNEARDFCEVALRLAASMRERADTEQFPGGDSERRADAPPGTPQE